MSVKAGPFPRRRGGSETGSGAGLPGPVDRRCHLPRLALGCRGVCACSVRRVELWAAIPDASAPVPGEPRLRWQLLVSTGCWREAELGQREVALRKWKAGISLPAPHAPLVRRAELKVSLRN